MAEAPRNWPKLVEVSILRTARRIHGLCVRFPLVEEETCVWAHLSLCAERERERERERE